MSAGQISDGEDAQGGRPLALGAGVRTLDASLNRAREALRVLEDVARFELDHAGLSAELKVIRHGLAEVAGAVPGGVMALMAARDTPGDVGTEHKTLAELMRADVRAVAVAAGKRLGEALRTIEECLKVLAPAAAARQVEALRYRGYEVEKRLVLALGTGRGVQWQLCVLISEALCVRPWERVAAEAIAGGADCVQLREKELGGAELLARARALVAIARATPVGGGSLVGGSLVGGRGVAARASVIINDRPDIALLAGADGVHLGQEDLSVESVRRLAGDGLVVGVSTHDLAEARRAVDQGADYCGVGAMFTTATKARAVSGVGYLRAYVGEAGLSRVPHLAIGGITPENVGELAAARCRGVAVSAVVCGAADPGVVCGAIVRGLRGGGGGG